MRKKSWSGAVTFVALAAAVLPMLSGGASQATVTFRQPVSLKDSANEPVVEVGPSGSIYVSGIHGLVSHSPTWRSTDGGSTYQPLLFGGSQYNRLPGGGDSDLATAPGFGTTKDRLYFLDLWAGSNSIARSDDGGDTWAFGSPFTSLPLSDRQWIGVGSRDAQGKDTVYIVYHFIQAPGSLAIAKSTDSGETWLTHVLPVGLTGANPGQLVVKAGPDGKDYVAFVYINGGKVHVASSDDSAVTWRDTVATRYNTVFGNSLTSIALDGDDLYASWIGSDFSMNVQHSPDRGKTWDDLWYTVANDGSSLFSWITARDGKVALSYYHAGNIPAGSDPNTATTAKWTIDYAEMNPGDTGFSTPVHASGGGDGKKVTVKNGPICTQGLSCTANRELGDFQQIAIDAAGKSVISYVNLLAGGATVVKQS